MPHTHTHTFRNVIRGLFLHETKMRHTRCRTKQFEQFKMCHIVSWQVASNKRQTKKFNIDRIEYKFFFIEGECKNAYEFVFVTKAEKQKKWTIILNLSILFYFYVHVNWFCPEANVCYKNRMKMAEWERNINSIIKITGTFVCIPFSSTVKMLLSSTVWTLALAILLAAAAIVSA